MYPSANAQLFHPPEPARRSVEASPKDSKKPQKHQKTPTYAGFKRGLAGILTGIPIKTRIRRKTT
jgi:hypothetical protein